MDITGIKAILNLDLDDANMERTLIHFLSKDETIIPTILKIIDCERRDNNTLISDMNLELSRAHIYIELNVEKEKKSDESAFDKTFIIQKISEFYTKYKLRLTHCFNRFN